MIRDKEEEEKRRRGEEERGRVFPNTQYPTPNTLLIATTNLKKGGEMVQILGAANLGVAIVTLADFPPMPPVDETGETFSANAHLKVEAALAQTGLLSIADDGGLVVDALNGSPGVKSHRFLGEDTPFTVKMERILDMMRDVPDEQRTCRFQCVVAIAAPDGSRQEFTGICEGHIAHELKGEHGFGYDPIVIVSGVGKHMAELTPDEKHKISHRGKALAQALPYLRQLVEG